jgi:hypothetical protein
MNHKEMYSSYAIRNQIGRLCSILLFTLGTICATHAQGVTGQVTYAPSTLNPGDYTYTASFLNSPSSLNAIAFIWFGWTPNAGYYGYGGDLLSGDPLSIQVPAGWIGHATTGYYGPPYDGYSIQFTSSGGGLAPGQSVTFKFDSAESPASMAANSSYPYGSGGTYPDLYSYFYQTTSETGNQGAFVASLAAAPEPSAPALITFGAIALLAVGRGTSSRRRAQTVVR